MGGNGTIGPPPTPPPGRAAVAATPVGTKNGRGTPEATVGPGAVVPSWGRGITMGEGDGWKKVLVGDTPGGDTPGGDTPEGDTPEGDTSDGDEVPTTAGGPPDTPPRRTSAGGRVEPLATATAPPVDPTPPRDGAAAEVADTAAETADAEAGGA